MSPRPKLEVAAWIAAIVGTCLAAVTTFWPRSPTDERSQPASPPPAAVQLNQPGATGTQINGPVTIYPPAAPPSHLPKQTQPSPKVQQQRPSHPATERPPKSVTTAPPKLVNPIRGCLASSTSLDSVPNAPYLASGYCETIRIGLQNLMGCELTSLLAAPTEKRGFATQYGLNEPFIDQLVSISYSSSEDCNGNRSGQITASRRRFTQLNKLVYQDHGSIHQFILVATFGND